MIFLLRQDKTIMGYVDSPSLKDALAKMHATYDEDDILGEDKPWLCMTFSIPHRSEVFSLEKIEEMMWLYEFDAAIEHEGD